MYHCGDIVMNCEPYITNDIKEMTELAQQMYNDVDTNYWAIVLTDDYYTQLLDMIEHKELDSEIERLFCINVIVSDWFLAQFGANCAFVDEDLAMYILRMQARVITQL